MGSRNTAFLCHEPKYLYFFTTNSSQRAVEHLIKRCYFGVWNLNELQTIGIPIETDPAPFGQICIYQKMNVTL